MLTVSGILLLVAGASLTFAVDRQFEGVDVQLMGWILMAGGGMALIAAMLRAAALESAAREEARHEEMLQVTDDERGAA